MATIQADTVAARPVLGPVQAAISAAQSLTPALWVLVAGLVALIVPTMASVARDSWSTEQGAHGPIVLATGLWLLARQWPSVASVRETGSTWVVAASLAVLLPLYILCRITAIVEVEGFVMYASALTVVYGLIGGRAMRMLWFPLFYLAFTLPPPETVVALVTQPLKIAISQWAISLLYWIGYPIGGAGVTIQIGQYQLLVAAACSGLNSLISLFALSLFYVYMRHSLRWQYAMVLVAIIIPIAVFANFVRVIILILLTHYYGEAVAQGFMHNFAGLAMFMIAMLTIFLVDTLLYPVWQRLFPEEVRHGR